EKYNASINNINGELNNILYSRLTKKVEKMNRENENSGKTIEELISGLELPSSLRSYLGEESEKKGSGIQLAQFLDGLSFPFFASALLLSAHYTSARVLYNNRSFLNDFSKRTGKYIHPERVLWLTDTFDDKNGVSTVLQSMHKEIKERKLPIDILTCSSTIQSDDNLIVLKPACEFTVPFYKEQPLRIPNLLELHKLFHEGEYDRIVCSTEGIMGLMALYLKNAYSVEASFYIHTDWVMFARKILKLDIHNENRIRRILRTFYGSFDRVFVLNTDQHKWLTGPNMNLKPEKVRLTAHWVDSVFAPSEMHKKEVFGVDKKVPVLLFVGRISDEKGVRELPRIYKAIRQKHPDVRLVVVGQGPAKRQLQEELPEASYYDWIEHTMLPEIYSSADLLLFPSRFDTFSCVVLESLSCGLPVVAYRTKGPKDIIVHEENGFLVENEKEMADTAIKYLDNKKMHVSFRAAAVQRAKNYNVNTILNNFIREIGL
ncbi:MAG TPA: glycosyltransferase, partial [Bacteroidales bacterium]